MVLHNPNNWHWVNKDVSEWGKAYLDKNLKGISAQKDGASAEIAKVESMTGDMDVSQRKGKVITLFDVRLVLDFDGKTKDGEAVKGTITIPEVAHDTEEDEYVFNIDVTDATSAKDAVKALVRSQILPQLRMALCKLAPALISEHGKAIQHAPGTGPSSGTSTPLSTTTSSSAAQALAKPAPTSTSSGRNEGPLVNTSAVTSTAEFRTTAAELYTTFTDVKRLTALTRSPPTQFEGAHPGGRFALFGGGVTGWYESVEAPRRIVQRWRLAQWPAGHHSQLELHFDQNDADHVTVMRVTWDAVPVGEEENTKEKWGEYYVRSLKTVFGFGTIL